MNNVYTYLNDNPNTEGIIEILGTTCRITRVTNLRNSEKPELGGVSRPFFGVWYIQPEPNVYLRVELV